MHSHLLSLAVHDKGRTLVVNRSAGRLCPWTTDNPGETHEAAGYQSLLPGFVQR